jgi:transcriptional regulator GlxA family with amidase domain
MHTPPPTLTIALLAFDQMEALDFAGPFEVFTTAARVHARLQVEAGLPPPAAPLFGVTTVARTRGPVTARAGLRVLPDVDFAHPLTARLLLVPGGVVDEAMACPHTLAWVRRLHAASPCTASVCTGAFILAAAGVLTTQTVTTHWEDQADLQQRFPALAVVGGVRWVEADLGRTVTSAGISAGIAMALHLVATMARAQGFDGPALAARTARQMEYEWTPQP